MGGGRDIDWKLGRANRSGGEEIKCGGDGSVKAVLNDEIVGEGAVYAACIPKSNSGAKECLESGREGGRVWHSAKESNNIGFINATVSNELRDGNRRLLPIVLYH